MADSAERERKAARQWFELDQSLGVDFAVRPTKRNGVADAGTPSAPALSGAVTLGATATSATAKHKTERLSVLQEEHDTICPHCTKTTGHTQTVFGEGRPDADLMFIGEAPGAEEDRTGRPFVGRAGQKLNDMIKAMGLQREQVYIANVLKSRPPNNRTPLGNEVAACSPYLVQQIRIIEPRVIVTLGGPATKLMLNTDIGITRLRGLWAEYRDDEAGLVIPVMPTFHPAYLLRNYTPETRQKVWADLQAVMGQLGLK